jgi:glutamate/tyrosine decarboxylase-like PLP-dependent enzyme
VPSEELDPDFRNKRAHFLPKLVVYASTEAHSAIEKAAHLAMVRLHPVDTDAEYAMRKGRLEYEILKDLERGLIPFFVHATAG